MTKLKINEKSPFLGHTRAQWAILLRLYVFCTTVICTILFFCHQCFQINHKQNFAKPLLNCFETGIYKG